MISEKDYENIPDHKELRRLGEKHFWEHFPTRFDTEVPFIQLHFEANTPRQLRQKWHEKELIISLQYMTNEVNREELDKISHKLWKTNI